MRTVGRMQRVWVKAMAPDGDISLDCVPNEMDKVFKWDRDVGLFAPLGSIPAAWEIGQEVRVEFSRDVDVLEGGGGPFWVRGAGKR